MGSVLGWTWQGSGIDFGRFMPTKPQRNPSENLVLPQRNPSETLANKGRASAASERSERSKRSVRELEDALRSKVVPEGFCKHRRPRKFHLCWGRMVKIPPKWSQTPEFKTKRRFPFLIKTGLCWRWFWSPRRPQDAPRGPQDDPRSPKMAPRRPQALPDGPKTAQDAAKSFPKRPKRRPDAPRLIKIRPKWSQVGAKSAKTNEKRGPKSDSILDPVSDPILDRF